jgi:LysR substrate binding domain
MNTKANRVTDDLSIGHIRAFLDVYDAATGEGKYSSYKELFGEVGTYSSVFGQIERIMGYLNVNLDVAEGHKFAPLFRPHAQTGHLKPTEAAHALAARFRVLSESYSDIRTVVTGLMHKPKAPRPVRIGAIQTFATRLLPNILSQASEVLPNIVLQPSVGKPLALLQRLEEQLLDCVFLYVPEDAKRPQPAPGWKDINVCSFGYRSRMVLLCPPGKPLWTRRGSEARQYGDDANRDYHTTDYVALTLHWILILTGQIACR